MDLTLSRVAAMDLEELRNIIENELGIAVDGDDKLEILKQYNMLKKPKAQPKAQAKAMIKKPPPVPPKKKPPVPAKKPPVPARKPSPTYLEQLDVSPEDMSVVMGKPKPAVVRPTAPRKKPTLQKASTENCKLNDFKCSDPNKLCNVDTGNCLDDSAMNRKRFIHRLVLDDGQTLVGSQEELEKVRDLLGVSSPITGPPKPPRGRPPKIAVRRKPAPPPKPVVDIPMEEESNILFEDEVPIVDDILFEEDRPSEATSAPLRPVEELEEIDIDFDDGPAPTPASAPIPRQDIEPSDIDFEEEMDFGDDILGEDIPVPVAVTVPSPKPSVPAKGKGKGRKAPVLAKPAKKVVSPPIVEEKDILSDEDIDALFEPQEELGVIKTAKPKPKTPRPSASDFSDEVMNTIARQFSQCLAAQKK